MATGKRSSQDGFKSSYLPFHRVEQFETKAKSLLTKQALGYYSSGATDERTLKENSTAFSRLLLKWRCLRGVVDVDLRTTVQGDAISFPICVAPSAMQRMARPDGEVAMARACAEVNTVMTLSTFATSSIEEVAAGAGASDADGGGAAAPRWFQLYIFTNRAVTRRLVERAEKCGYKAIVMTIDLPRTGIRYADWENGFRLPSHLRLANFDGEHEFNVAQEHSGQQTDTPGYSDVVFDSSICWEDIDWLKSITKLPIIVKGVMSAEDATEALKRGVSGIWVSNHGARQLDSTAATIEVLPEVVRAVDGRVEVYMDGGIRCGGDVLKALALGARAVFVGRPVLWGLACNGDAGVRQVLQLLTKELELSLALCGCSSVRDIPRSIVVPASQYRSSL